MNNRTAQCLSVLLLWLATMVPAAAQPRGPLVLAASSMQESLTEAANIWAAKGHAKPVISFAASSALARQILAGAPADLFIPSDREWMDAIAAKRLIRPASRTLLVTNQLVLIAPASSRAKLVIAPGFPLAKAIGSGRLAMADPAAVPAGKYARQALTSLGIWAAVAPKIAVGDNVRASLALVGRGESPFGIVYATDARAAKAVRVVGVFPVTSHRPIHYLIATLTSATNPETDGFRRFLISQQGQAIFAKYGFGTRQVSNADT